MTLFFNQMLGCLIIAAGIGGAVGWLLRHVSADKSAQQLADVTAMMHLKEQMLEKARQQLRGEATSKLPPGESELATSQTLSNFNQENFTSQEPVTSSGRLGIDTDRLHARLQESEEAGGWIEWLDIQLTQRDEKHRIALDEVMLQLAERDQHIRELEQQNQADAHQAFPPNKAA
ncbi:MAG: hypothetical protein E8D41_13340 [Nitrospira sp.]|nr:MAG: hypothetical protein E8D41_13340 [Nitrospira sp.]